MDARLAILALVLALSLPARAQWARVTGIPATEVGAVHVSGSTLYAGALDAVYTSHDGGATWVRSASLPAGLDGVWALAEHDGRLFAGSYGGVLESADGGATGVRRDSGLVGLGARDLSSFAVYRGHLYAATFGSGVFRLDLAAASPVWEPFSDGLPGNVETVLGTDGLLVAGASANGAVYLREDGAPAWTERQFTPFDPNGPVMYDLAEVSGVLVGGSSHGLFRSADRGQTWARSDPGGGVWNNVALATDGPHVYALATHLVSGTHVYLSDDAGLTWELLERVPGATTYAAAAWGGRLYAGRFDGLWGRALDTTAGDDATAPSGLALHAPRPTPSSGPTTLAFSLDTAGPARLAVFDALGREVAVPFDRGAAAGETLARWDASGLPAGVYVARLEAGGQAVSRRVTVVR